MKEMLLIAILCFFAGSICTIESSISLLKHTPVMENCNSNMYDPHWTNLYDVMWNINKMPAGMHCFGGMMVVRAPESGKIYEETLKQIADEETGD